MDNYIEGVFKYEIIHSSTKRLRNILDAKYEKIDMNKVMNKQCQHVTGYQHNNILRFPQNSEDFLWNFRYVENGPNRF